MSKESAHFVDTSSETPTSCSSDDRSMWPPSGGASTHLASGEDRSPYERYDVSTCDVVAVDESGRTWQEGVGAPAASESGGNERGLLDSTVYRHALESLIPCCVHFIGPAPWLDDEGARDERRSARVHRLHRRLGAALTVAVPAEIHPHRADQAYLRELVRCALIRWELALFGDGRPVRRCDRHHPLQAAIVSHVVRLVSETAGFQTAMLLDDIERHMRWLARRRAHTAWVEAALISALADCSILVGRRTLRDRARHRLVELLAVQDPEGWFPERGGADVGCLSLTVDALARTYRQNEWVELEEPLRRALRFLTHFVHPDGSAGGVYGSCHTSFLCPYGVELLAPLFPEAAVLVPVVRRQSQRLNAGAIQAGDQDFGVLLGASTALAATMAAPTVTAAETLPHERPGRTNFPRAGLFTFSTRDYYAVVQGKRGGALRVSWRTPAVDLEDSGVTVIGAHRTLTSGQGATPSTANVTDSSILVSGSLDRNDAVRPSMWSRVRRALRKLMGRRRRSSHPPAASARGSRVDSAKRTQDHHDREIQFREDAVCIHDRVHCRGPRATIVCQSSTRVPATKIVDGVRQASLGRPPIFVDGARTVEITRTYRAGELVDPRVEVAGAIDARRRAKTLS